MDNKLSTKTAKITPLKKHIAVYMVEYMSFTIDKINVL